MDRKWCVNPAVWLILGLLFAASIKVWLVLGGWVPFNADEAVVALMARHILQGRLPVFFYGQVYLGSLDAFLVAGGFALFGEHVWVIRLVQGLLYIGVMATTAWLGQWVFGSRRTGIMALILLSMPTVNVTLYTTASLGGYGEAILLGNLILLCGLRIVKDVQSKRFLASYWYWLGLGVLSVFGLWAFGLTLIYSIPTLIYVSVLSLRYLGSKSSDNEEKSGENPKQAPYKLSGFYRLTASLLVFITGALLGSFPWWGYAVGIWQWHNGFEKLLVELGGAAIAGVERLPWIFQVGQHAVNLIVLGSTVTLGLRPPWEFSWLALPLIPFILVFWMMVIIHMTKSLAKKDSSAHAYSQQGDGLQNGAQWLLIAVVFTLLTGFVLTPFGADPSGRYFLPLAVPLSLFASHLILDLRMKYERWAYGLAVMLLVYNLWGTIQSAMRFPPGITTQFYTPTQIDHRFDQELIDFLHQKGETRGYCNYWISYPLAFLSKEELIFVPRLPYHLDFRYTERDDRYPLYDEMVAQSDRVAYITSNHPALDERLRSSFERLNITWHEIQIGDYHVFYDLSLPVRPFEIGLGKTTTP